MSKIPVSKASGEIPDLKPGVYEVTCVEVKDDTLANPQYGDGNVVKLYMSFDDVLDTEGEHFILDAMANRKLSPLSKLTRWAEALGRPINFDAEVEFDTAELLGGQCLARVTRVDENSWPKVEDLTARPVKGMAVAKPAAKPSGEPDYDAFWKNVRAIGKAEADVIPLLPNKNLLDMQDATGAQLVEILERLSA